jgi:hypothetical protein
VPTPHLAHTEEPADDWNVPTAHAVHADFVTFEYVPTGHDVHPVTPSTDSLNIPAAQALHPFPPYPALHTHVPSLVALHAIASLLVELHATHLVHTEAPLIPEKVPFEQFAHTLALSIDWYLPASQRTHVVLFAV